MNTIKIKFGDRSEEIISVKNLRLYDEGSIMYEDKNGCLVILPKGFKEIKIFGGWW